MLYIRREGAESDSKIGQAKTKYTGMSKILQKWSHLMSHTHHLREQTCSIIKRDYMWGNAVGKVLKLQKWSHLMSHTPSFEGTDMFNNQTGLYVGQCGGQSTKIY